MKTILERLHVERYVNVYVILLIDLSASLAASVLSLAGLSLLFPDSAPYTPGFLAEWLLSGLAGIGLLFYMLKTYYAVIRHSNLREVGSLALSVAGKEAATACCMLLYPALRYSFAHYAGLLVIDGLLTLSVLVLLRVAMVAAYDLLRRRVQNARKLETALIYGTDDKAISFVRTMEQSPKYNVAGFLVFGDSDKRATSSPASTSTASPASASSQPWRTPARSTP